MANIDEVTREWLADRISALEEHFQGDVAFHFGAISSTYDSKFVRFVERLAEEEKSHRLVVVLNTPGGSAETVEKMVRVMRHHYDEVYFVVPDFAMSAGTILCMSGDKIYMDYTASLGPIDPQVWNGNDWVPALGYLDKVDEFVEKARNNQLTDAEFMILQGLDLAMLSRFEQQKKLTVTLLQEWLAKYKFKDWKVHETDAAKKGKPVTDEERRLRAVEVAEILGNNKLWHSHGRMIGVETLRGLLRLKIEDYSDDAALRELIRGYNDVIVGHIGRANIPHFLHSRNFF